MINELDQVALDRDLPEHSLTRGDIGTVVLIHAGGAGYEVEFTTLDGATIAVVTLRASDVRGFGESEIAHVRPMSAA